jgi:NAD(P)-dependent dehydrogenase (short-subunit alcohol dehydrogenase family)
MPTALVTGSSDGIGLETARGLLARAWTVLLHGRNPARAASAAQALSGGPGTVVPVSGDLASMDAVRDLGRQTLGAAPSLDCLILNAGVYESKRSLTADGFERTMAINHFAHVLLFSLLQKGLARAAAPRVLWLSSGLHQGAALDLDDLDLARGWSGGRAYGASKLANAVCAAEAARRSPVPGLLSFSLHPGVVHTKLLTQNFGGGGVPVAEGAKTSLHCATAAGLERFQGGYFSDSAPRKPDARVLDPEFGSQLWERSLERLNPWL